MTSPFRLRAEQIAENAPIIGTSIPGASLRANRKLLADAIEAVMAEVRRETLEEARDWVIIESD